eukprot:2765412-Rhodomonas_salina.2
MSHTAVEPYCPSSPSCPKSFKTRVVKVRSWVWVAGSEIQGPSKGFRSESGTDGPKGPKDMRARQRAEDLGPKQEVPR